jgi:hypothetical protein
MDITRFLHDLVSAQSKQGMSSRLFGGEEQGITSNPLSPWQQRYGAGMITTDDVKEPMTRQEVKQARVRDGVTLEQNPRSGPKMSPKKGVFRL